MNTIYSNPEMVVYMLNNTYYLVFGVCGLGGFPWLALALDRGVLRGVSSAGSADRV